MSQPKSSIDILVCVIGLTPQVVTETVYALAHATDPAIAMIPDEIHVITTKQGRERALLTLLGQRGGKDYLGRLCRDYGLDRSRIRFDAGHIHVIANDAGQELDDIEDEAGNQAAADQISRLIQRLTQDSSTRLHVSLAGGRKTMGFYAGYALSLYARPQDRLSHVLVNPPFESHPEFFYPPPQPETLTAPGRNHYISTADANVRLAEIPFVRLRDGLDPGLLAGEFGFSEAIARAQQAFDKPELRIDLSERTVYLQGQPVRLSPTAFLWLLWFADRAKRGLSPARFDEDGALDLLRVVDWLEGRGGGPLRQAAEEALAELRQGVKAPNYFERNRSRLNKALRERAQLGPQVIRKYEIQSVGQRPQTGYCLLLEPGQIRIQGSP